MPTVIKTGTQMLQAQSGGKSSIVPCVGQERELLVVRRKQLLQLDVLSNFECEWVGWLVGGDVQDDSLVDFCAGGLVLRVREAFHDQ
jgi:hypothetical protein